jgi:hypothetical protein
MNNSDEELKQRRKASMDALVAKKRAKRASTVSATSVIPELGVPCAAASTGGNNNSLDSFDTLKPTRRKPKHAFSSSDDEEDHESLERKQSTRDNKRMKGKKDPDEEEFAKDEAEYDSSFQDSEEVEVDSSPESDEDILYVSGKRKNNDELLDVSDFLGDEDSSSTSFMATEPFLSQPMCTFI